MLQNWIGTKHAMQNFFGMSLHKLLRHHIRRLVFAHPIVNYPYTFKSFAKNPGNFSAQGTASGYKIKLSDGKFYPTSKTFYYNSIKP